MTKVLVLLDFTTNVKMRHFGTLTFIIGTP